MLFLKQNYHYQVTDPLTLSTWVRCTNLKQETPWICIWRRCFIFWSTCSGHQSSHICIQGIVGIYVRLSYINITSEEDSNFQCFMDTVLKFLLLCDQTLNTWFCFSGKEQKKGVEVIEELHSINDINASIIILCKWKAKKYDHRDIVRCFYVCAEGQKKGLL